jgi:carotenoid cleavage dioxygenase
MAAATPFHLQGNFAPVTDELTVAELEVTGAIPPELRGALLPQRAQPADRPVAALVPRQRHAPRGRAARRSSDLVPQPLRGTPLYESPGSSRVRADGSLDRTAALANTHVICHAGRIMALEEGSFPWLVSPELETLGPHDFGGRLRSAMTAHPRICPVTGELLFFGYGVVPPYLVYHRVAADGTLVQSEEITVKDPTMMHDWNMTRNHVVFMDLPLVFDLALIARGAFPVRWSDDHGARLGLMPREGTDADVEWYEIDPCYVFHAMNAFEEGERIVLDVARFPKLAFGPDDTGGEPAVLHRWILDRAAGKVLEQPLDDRPADFPRVADAVVGLPHRYGYMLGTGGWGPGYGQELYKYDLRSGSSWTCRFGPGLVAGEPVFAAGAAGGAEDEGWLLTFLYDAARDRSDLVILDATRLERGPIARVHLPCRVPHGFHGSWIPDPA